MLAYRAISKALNKDKFIFLVRLQLSFISAISYLAFIVAFPTHCNCVFRRKARIALLKLKKFYFSDFSQFYRFHGLWPPLVLFEMRNFANSRI
ncbi:hypothetical protein CSUIS_0867 [Campylobacter porcelli]|uniref:Uncharacterized protein n=1 Tax=Campylobacter porcelli TaxID=1660073 RepID=A0A1X9SWR2_9BACT|nr:hypothetical protein CSUIS_0867 [Campylobacter sp. RM6137]